MLFNSYLFIFAFLPIVIVGFLFLRQKKPVYPIIWIILASLFYYGWWKPEFLLLLSLSVTVNLIFGKILIKRTLPPSLLKATLITGITFNLCMLGYFKYAGFIIFNLNALFNAGLPPISILLPLGISFITFQKIAFLVDAYRGEVKHFTILNYIFFVTFFPQLIAGPIVHHADIMPQLENAPKRNFHADFSIGMSIFIIGLFKKVVVADTLAVYANAGYNMIQSGQPMDTASAWITALSYTLQLYFDFSGYSDMAIGFGRMFGIILPLNFYSPYKATSIIDFWRRWHISLSRFLRDYLYYPLGGNRKGPVRRYLNLGIVMFLGGLWHGANWTFALWGSIHGGLLMLNHAWRRLPFTRSTLYQANPVKAISIIVTFMLVTLAWVPFRANSMHDAYTMMSYLFPLTDSPLGFSSFISFIKTQLIHVRMDATMMDWFKPYELWPKSLSPDYIATMTKPSGLIIVLCLLAVFTLPNTAQLFSQFKPAIGMDKLSTGEGTISRLNGKTACILGFLFMLSVLRLAHVSPFLYFQF